MEARTSMQSAASGTHATADSHSAPSLFTIPPELQRMIFAYSLPPVISVFEKGGRFTTDANIIAPVEDNPNLRAIQYQWKGATALARVNKQLSKTVPGLMCEVTRFEFDSAMSFVAFSNIMKRWLPLLRRVKVHGSWGDQDYVEQLFGRLRYARDMRSIDLPGDLYSGARHSWALTRLIIAQHSLRSYEYIAATLTWGGKFGRPKVCTDSGSQKNYVEAHEHMLESEYNNFDELAVQYFYQNQNSPPNTKWTDIISPSLESYDTDSYYPQVTKDISLPNLPDVVLERIYRLVLSDEVDISMAHSPGYPIKSENHHRLCSGIDRANWTRHCALAMVNKEIHRAVMPFLYEETFFNFMGMLPFNTFVCRMISKVQRIQHVSLDLGADESGIPGTTPRDTACHRSGRVNRNMAHCHVTMPNDTVQHCLYLLGKLSRLDTFIIKDNPENSYRQCKERSALSRLVVAVLLCTQYGQKNRRKLTKVVQFHGFCFSRHICRGDGNVTCETGDKCLFLRYRWLEQIEAGLEEVEKEMGK